MHFYSASHYFLIYDMLFFGLLYVLLIGLPLGFCIFYVIFMYYRCLIMIRMCCGKGFAYGFDLLFDLLLICSFFRKMSNFVEILWSMLIFISGVLIFIFELYWNAMFLCDKLKLTSCGLSTCLLC